MDQDVRKVQSEPAELDPKVTPAVYSGSVDLGKMADILVDFQTQQDNIRRSDRQPVPSEKIVAVPPKKASRKRSRSEIKLEKVPEDATDNKGIFRLDPEGQQDTRVRPPKPATKLLNGTWRQIRLRDVEAACEGEDIVVLWAHYTHPDEMTKDWEKYLNFKKTRYIDDENLITALKKIDSALSLEMFLRERYGAKAKAPSSSARLKDGPVSNQPLETRPTQGEENSDSIPVWKDLVCSPGMLARCIVVAFCTNQLRRNGVASVPLLDNEFTSAVKAGKLSGHLARGDNPQFSFRHLPERLRKLRDYGSDIALASLRGVLLDRKYLQRIQGTETPKVDSVQADILARQILDHCWDASPTSPLYGGIGSEDEEGSDVLESIADPQYSSQLADEELNDDDEGAEEEDAASKKQRVEHTIVLDGNLRHLTAQEYLRMYGKSNNSSKLSATSQFHMLNSSLNQPPVHLPPLQRNDSENGSKASTDSRRGQQLRQVAFPQVSGQAIPSPWQAPNAPTAGAGQQKQHHVMHTISKELDAEIRSLLPNKEQQTELDEEQQHDHHQDDHDGGDMVKRTNSIPSSRDPRQRSQPMLYRMSAKPLPTSRTPSVKSPSNTQVSELDDALVPPDQDSLLNVLAAAAAHQTGGKKRGNDEDERRGSEWMKWSGGSSVGRPASYDGMVSWCIQMKRALWRKYNLPLTLAEAVDLVNALSPDPSGRRLVPSTLRKRVLATSQVTWAKLASSADPHLEDAIEDKDVLDAIPKALELLKRPGLQSIATGQRGGDGQAGVELSNPPAGVFMTHYDLNFNEPNSNEHMWPVLESEQQLRPALVSDKEVPVKVETVVQQKPQQEVQDVDRKAAALKAFMDANIEDDDSMFEAVQMLQYIPPFTRKEATALNSFWLGEEDLVRKQRVFKYIKKYLELNDPQFILDTLQNFLPDLSAR